MALPLGKLAFIIGGGIVGSVLLSDVQLPGFADVISGSYQAIKVIRNAIQNDKAPASAKPRKDLIEQVDIIRKELQILASNRHVTIVTSTSSGRSKYGLLIIVVVVGYGYVWWKGWKLSDMTLATKGSLKSATNVVAKELDNVHTSLSETKRDLSSRIKRVDGSLDECVKITAATKEEVSGLRGSTSNIKMDVQFVQNAVTSLESKLIRIEGKQDVTNYGVKKLIDKAISMESHMSVEKKKALPPSSTRPALEIPQMTSSDRAASLPPITIEELPSSPPPPSNRDPKMKRYPSDVSAFGLKALHGDTDAVQASCSPKVSNPSQVTEEGNSGSHVFRRAVSAGVGAFPFFRSATKS